MTKRVQKLRPAGWWTLFYGIGWVVLVVGLAMMLINIITVIRIGSNNVDLLAGFFASLPLTFVGSMLVSANWAQSKISYCSCCGTEITNKEDKACRICWRSLE